MAVMLSSGYNGDATQVRSQPRLGRYLAAAAAENFVFIFDAETQVCRYFLRFSMDFHENFSQHVPIQAHDSNLFKNYNSNKSKTKRSTDSLSSTPRFSNSHSPSSSSSAFASSTSSFSRSTSFFHRASSPTRVNLSAPSVRFSLDSFVSRNRSIAVASRQANAHHHKRTTLEPRFGCLLRFRPSRTAVTSATPNLMN
ncbi:hypothetical protein Fmac_000776 [Flemingia macrophylla]|uniref:Uncharacterized protein n=1 Tax=Flemingia macrophylla TaxID=520843 RepID=A0ABD1NFC4_9FABA